MTSTQLLSSDADSALTVVQNLLASLSIPSSSGRARFDATLHPHGHMVHARYSRVSEPVFHNFDNTSPDSLQAFVAASGCWNDPSDRAKGADAESGPNLVVLDSTTSTVQQRDTEKEQLPEFEESIAGEATVMVDHDIAMVWAPFYFRSKGKVSHVGTNIFNLVKVYKDGKVGGDDWEWKVATALDTARAPSDEEASISL